MAVAAFVVLAYTLTLLFSYSRQQGAGRDERTALAVARIVTARPLGANGDNVELELVVEYTVGQQQVTATFQHFILASDIDGYQSDALIPGFYNPGNPQEVSFGYNVTEEQMAPLMPDFSVNFT